MTDINETGNKTGERVTIEKMLNNGQGLARNKEGQVVFVPDALPGEIFILETVTKRKGVLWAQQTSRLDASPMRETTPPCVHFPQCGGCRMLHVRHQNETELKTEFLRDVLTRIGKIKEPVIEARSFPMNQSRIRGKFHVDRQGRLGFKQAAADRVTPITQCLVIPDSVSKLLPALQSLVKVWGFQGEIFFATDAQRQNPVLEFNGRLKPGLHLKKAIGLARPPVPFLFKTHGRDKHRNDKAIVNFQWANQQVNLSPSSFFQSNPDSWPLFAGWVTDFIKDGKLRRIWDAHAGAGFLSSHIQNAEVFCSEPDRAAFGKLKQLYGENKAFSLHHGSAESVVAEGVFPLETLDGVILDPPRAGLTTPLRTWLKQAGPPSLLYFSCDMASFSRDLKDLTLNYQVKSPILAMNLNPGTLRLETACVLEKRP